jgi:two-component system sensor histidine kinase DegS
MNLEYIQQLMAVDLEAAKQEIAHVQKLVHKATKEARLVLFELRPVILETQGLIPALERYVTQLNEDESLNIEMDLIPITQTIDIKVSGTIFSIVQEAVNNIKRHAKATTINLRVAVNEDNLLVYVQDNGVGFDVSGTQASYATRTSFGLLNMKERADLIEGVLTIKSETSGPSKGTEIILSVPFKTGTSPLKRSLLGET